MTTSSRDSAEEYQHPLEGFSQYESTEHWSHSKLTVFFGAVLGLLITFPLVSWVLRPFLVGIMPTYPLLIHLLTFFGTMFVLFFVIGKIIQRIRTRSLYYDDQTVDAIIDS